MSKNIDDLKRNSAVSQPKCALVNLNLLFYKVFCAFLFSCLYNNERL